MTRMSIYLTYFSLASLFFYPSPTLPLPLSHSALTHSALISGFPEGQIYLQRYFVRNQKTGENREHRGKAE